VRTGGSGGVSACPLSVITRLSATDFDALAAEGEEDAEVGGRLTIGEAWVSIRDARELQADSNGG
jgi:hypothetical protein